MTLGTTMIDEVESYHSGRQSNEVGLAEKRHPEKGSAPAGTGAMTNRLVRSPGGCI